MKIKVKLFNFELILLVFFLLFLAIQTKDYITYIYEIIGGESLIMSWIHGITSKGVFLERIIQECL